MKIVRRKKFSSFAEGKNETLNIMPMTEICYFELAACNRYEEVYSKLNINDISIRVNVDHEGFVFDIVFNIDKLNHIQNVLSIHQWELVEDECIGLSSRDVYGILNANWQRD